MRRQLDRFDFRIGPTTVALVKSTNDDRRWCAHTMRFSSFRRLCIQQKTKIAWCVPGLTCLFLVMYLAARHLLISHLVYINLPFELMTAITACCVPFGEVTSGGSHGWGGIGCLLCMFTSVIVSFDCLYVNVSYVSFMYVMACNVCKV